MTSSVGGIAFAIVLGAAVATVLGGCAGRDTLPSVAEAEQSALQLLRETERQIDLDWPEAPAPSADACGSGVRFGYYVAVKAHTDPKALAEELQRFWESKGLEVSSSQTDFGGSDGMLYSATADRNRAAGAAYQLSDAAVVIRITSPCAEGSVDDQKE